MSSSQSRSFVVQRRERILTELRHHHSMQVADLADLLGTSQLTIRRDLSYLESHGLITRHYGKATLVTTSHVTSSVSPYEGAKERIARAASEYIQDNDLVFVNTSSTALKLVEYIKAEGVAVVTNSTHAQSFAVPHNGMILLTGGEIRPPRGVLSGEFALANIRNVSASVSFVGCAGISLNTGVTSTTQQEAMVNALMVERSDRVILLADSSKLGISAGFSYASLSDISLLITDKSAADEDVEILLEAGIKEIRRV